MRRMLAGAALLAGLGAGCIAPPAPPRVGCVAEHVLPDEVQMTGHTTSWPPGTGLDATLVDAHGTYVGANVLGFVDTRGDYFFSFLLNAPHTLPMTATAYLNGGSSPPRQVCSTQIAY